MDAADPVAARWPGVPAGRGHYESYYVRAIDPAEPRGLWIRYTVFLASGTEPIGQLWCTVFDRRAPRVQALRTDAGPVTTGGDAWIQLGDSSFGATGLAGGLSTPAGSAEWLLKVTTDEQPLLHLPRTWMYTARLPRTKLTSPAPAAVFNGTLVIGGRTIDVEGWPGMVGHNWGEQHAERWIWLHGLGFDERGIGTWLDVAVGRVRLGRWVTPWVANGVLSLDGERMRLGGLGRRTEVIASPDRCEVRIPGPKQTVTLWADAPGEAFAAWDYANPDRSLHRVLNCSVADLRVHVERPGRAPAELAAPWHAAYEVGRPIHDRSRRTPPQSFVAGA